jgi:hypothetical protein
MFKNFKIDNARRVEFEDKFIQIPKSKWAYLRNNIDTFHTTGGDGTPSEPIPIVNIAEYNKTVTGQNLFNKLLTDIVYSTHNLTQTANGIRLTATSQTSFLYANDNYKYFLIKGETYTFKCKWKNSAVRGGKTYFTINRSGESEYSFGDTYWSDTNEKTALRNFTPTESGYYRIIFYAYHHSNQGAMLENDYCDFWDIQLLKGEYTAETMPAYKAYHGKTYPYRLEDTNNVLHECGSLPDGTCDSVNWGTSELIKRAKTKILDGTEDNTYWIQSDQLNDYLRVYIGGFTEAVADASGSQGTLLCSHFSNGPARTTLDLFECVSIDEGALYFKIAKSRLTGYSSELESGAKAALLRTYLGEQYNAGTPVVVQYKLITPETYQLKQYGKTYGGVVWEYNEKPIQVEDSVCNVFSDKNVKMKFKAVSY